MATCEVCGIDVPSIDAVGVEIAGQIHYVCGEDHLTELLHPAPPEASEIELPPLEDAPRPEPTQSQVRRMGRPPGSKNRPK